MSRALTLSSTMTTLPTLRTTSTVSVVLAVPAPRVLPSPSSPRITTSRPRTWLPFFLRLSKKLILSSRRWFVSVVAAVVATPVTVVAVVAVVASAATMAVATAVPTTLLLAATPDGN